MRVPNFRRAVLVMIYGTFLEDEENAAKSERKKMLKNIEMRVEGEVLTIAIDLTKEFGKSSSGKTTIIATTAGNVSIPGHEDIKVGVNCYR